MSFESAGNTRNRNIHIGLSTPIDERWLSAHDSGSTRSNEASRSKSKRRARRRLRRKLCQSSRFSSPATFLGVNERRGNAGLGSSLPPPSMAVWNTPPGTAFLVGDGLKYRAPCPRTHAKTMVPGRRSRKSTSVRWEGRGGGGGGGKKSERARERRARDG